MSCRWDGSGSRSRDIRRRRPDRWRPGGTVCAGLEPAVLLMRLGEAAIFQASFLEADVSPEVAHLAVEAFGSGAREEWLRIGSLAPAVRWGAA